MQCVVAGSFRWVVSDVESVVVETGVFCFLVICKWEFPTLLFVVLFVIVLLVLLCASGSCWL